MRHEVRMRFAHIMFYAGFAVEAPKAPITTGIVPEGHT